MDLPKGEPPSCSQIRSVPPYDGNRVAGVKVEEVADVKEEEDPASITSPLIKTEHGVSYLCPLLHTFHRYAELPASLSVHMAHVDCGERIVTVVVKKCEGHCILWHITCEIQLPICLKSVS